MRAAFDEMHQYHGQTCTLILGEQRIDGLVLGVNSSGELLLEIDGEVQAFAAGEVSLRPA